MENKTKKKNVYTIKAHNMITNATIIKCIPGDNLWDVIEKVREEIRKLADEKRKNEGIDIYNEEFWTLYVVGSEV